MSETIRRLDRRYTVGISIFVKADGTLGLYENGLRQNVLFLYQLFKASPNCERVFLLNHGEGEVSEDTADLGIDPGAIVRTQEVLDQLDYVVAMGAAMDGETVAALRQRGCKMISYKGGNGAVISMEATVAKPPRGDAERLFDHDFYDAIWMTPQHIHTYKGWCETVYRCPVYEVPQIWGPLFVERQVAVADSFGYRPGARPWRLGVMDPNITVMKTSHLPMLVAEAAYRRQPEAFQAIYVTNGWPHKDNAHFQSFTLALSAAKAGVMTLEPRFVSAHFLANHCDAVVTHHWENGLNYLYYEVLYGAYPLIYNSEFLQGYGYPYEAFDAESGADAVLAAYAGHDAGLDDYRRRNAELFARLSPTGAYAINLHEALLLAVG